MNVRRLLVSLGAASLFAKLAAPTAFRDLFERIGKEHGVDPDLLHAIAWHESNMNPQAVGPTNSNGTRDYGLMQINEANFAALGLDSSTALDPERSVRAAARLLAQIQQKNASVFDQLAVYNAGPSPIVRDGRAGGPKLTANGQYINTRYVVEAAAKLAVVKLGRVLPVGA